MTPEEIIAIAKEARISEMGLNIDGSSDLLGLFERFAALVASKEREACAQVCEAIRTNPPKGEPDDVERGFNAAIRRSAYAIRARDRNQATGVVTGGVQ